MDDGFTLLKPMQGYMGNARELLHRPQRQTMMFPVGLQ